MPPTQATSYLYCDADDVAMLLSDDGVTGRVDDDASGEASSAETAYLTRMIQWATGRINYYCLSKYPAADLAQSWVVNQWCSVIAAHMLSCRRGNPAAGSLSDLFDAAVEDLEQVQAGDVVLADVARRDHAFPAWSNLGAPSLAYRLRKLRVQTPLSSRKGDRGGQTTDLAAAALGPIEQH